MSIRVKNIIFILFGAAIFSFGLVHFNMQHNLGEGGFTGITLLLFFLWDMDPAVTNIVLNIPVFFIGWKILGKNAFVYTMVGTLSVSLFLWIFQKYQIPIGLEDDMTLVALFAGVFIGVGLGIIFRFGGTTGGVDIIARIINKYTSWSIGRAMFVFDFLVIITSILTFLELSEGMYTLVAVFIGARVIDFIQEGAYAAKGAFIISNHSEEIADQIMERMDRGVTILNGQGSFSKEKRNVLYCVVARNEIVRMKNIINETDPSAFVSLTTVHEVMGEGFTLDENKKPLDD
ncbi:YitT family protein [Oceanobacillus jeddahense]|uniref:YitT family protein n=1 Tax=Oceanobacillus jeddahense TaxID=1462527 RepID=A0ABY5JQ48_9BACI|nr:YitT family protein [Oceanobacillus jeddahense]UUI00982.1 YitT family protein [Oceanobacillus jeddahense]